MIEPTSDKHFEEKFEYPLWTLIKKYADENDVSYRDAVKAVMPGYVNTIRYGDLEFENRVIREYEEGNKTVEERWQKLIGQGGR